jgi:isoleucyl-tRNA synthetase
MGCNFTDRIEVGLVTKSDALKNAVESFRDYICAETLAVKLQIGALRKVSGWATKVGDIDVELYIQVVR